MSNKIMIPILLLTLLLTTPAYATETFNANLRAKEGVTSGASGSARFVLDNAETEIAFTVTLLNLSSNELAAHVHRENGEIVVTLPMGPNKTGIWQNPSFLDLVQLRHGQLFVLVHTTDYPGGEVRGDPSAITVTNADNSIGKLKSRFK